MSPIWYCMGVNIYCIEFDVFLSRAWIQIECDSDLDSPLSVNFICCEPFENHVARLQVTVIHSHFLEALEIEDIFCGPCINEAPLDSRLVDSFFDHPDFKHNGCDSSFLVEYEVFFEERDGPVWAHVEV